MKSMLRWLAATVDIDTYQRLMAYSILRCAFKDLASCPNFQGREALWEQCIAAYGGESQTITYVEFGVHEGYSIEYFARRNHSIASSFIGLDSFEGLPEQWGILRKGHFDTSGGLPNVSDGRVEFIKGWFQNTYTELYARLVNVNHLVVHYDADLYSSTLFALNAMDGLKRSYLAIFDEFTGHETRALYNYIQAYNATVRFRGKTLSAGYPSQVLCEIVPNGQDWGQGNAVQG